MKHRNTTSREKKDVQNFVFRYKETQSFKKQKYVWQYIQKKTEPKFGGYLYKYGLLRCFHKWAVSKRKKKKKKNTKPRIIQIWCSREIIRNKKTREKKKWNKKEKKNSLKKKKIYKSLSPETQSVKKHKCQET